MHRVHLNYFHLARRNQDPCSQLAGIHLFPLPFITQNHSIFYQNLFHFSFECLEGNKASPLWGPISGRIEWGQNGLQGLRSGAQRQAPGEPKIRVDWPEAGGGLAGDRRQKLWLCLWLTLQTPHTFPKRLCGLNLIAHLWVCVLWSPALPSVDPALLSRRDCACRTVRDGKSHQGQPPLLLGDSCRGGSFRERWWM